MIRVGDRVSLRKDPCIEGYKIGDTGTVLSIEAQEYFFPVEVEMDHPDMDGHSYYRFDFDQLGVIKTNSWLDHHIPEGADIPL